MLDKNVSLDVVLPQTTLILVKWTVSLSGLIRVIFKTDHSYCLKLFYKLKFKNAQNVTRPVPLEEGVTAIRSYGTMGSVVFGQLILNLTLTSIGLYHGQFKTIFNCHSNRLISDRALLSVFYARILRVRDADICVITDHKPYRYDEKNCHKFPVSRII